MYSQEIKHSLEIGLHSNSSGSVYNSEEEKMQVVNEKTRLERQLGVNN